MIRWFINKDNDRIFLPTRFEARGENPYGEMADAEVGCGMQLGHEEYIDSFNRTFQSYTPPGVRDNCPSKNESYPEAYGHIQSEVRGYGD